ncbi:Thioredoxin H2 [Striga hermonthica]|uniref:Thioredoxin H2 n=1 Tax=Striga hermonthica TaxID=68872 RepID=A0A9N7RM52_STRHE|nr:Thioredoxin H2 [Striga hermonthica]
MTGGSKFEVSKFDGHGNFGLWQTRVKDLLAQQGIQKGLRAEKPKGMEDDDWQDLQERAAGTIRLCLADEVMYHVMHLKSADEIWKKLESQFMSKTLTTKLYLKQRLYGLKMQEGTDFGQHVNIFNQVVTDLASLEVKIEDEDKAMILLCSLPPSYEHMVTTLTYGKETIKTEEITSALLAHNQRKQKSGESSSQSDSLYVKGNQDRGRKQVRDNSGNRNFRSKSRDKSKGRKTVTCYKCKKQGHFKQDCPKWKKQTADMSSKSANVVQNEESDCSDGDMLSISTAQYDDAWILDSGCSYHITPNREWFATYKSGNSGSVFLGDDRCCGIVGIGDVKIKINGFIPKADEDRETIKIVKGALTVMKGRITAGNIYKLLGTVLDKGESSSSAPDDVDHDVSGPTDVPESYKLARDRVRRTNIQAPVRKNQVIAFHSSSKWKFHFEASKQISKLIVIDFTASWCGPCHSIQPAVEEFAETYTDVDFVKIDVDELDGVATEFGVHIMPTFILIKRGEEVDKVVGAKREELRKKIEQHRF